MSLTILYTVIFIVVVLLAFLDLTQIKNNKVLYWLLFFVLVAVVGSRDYSTGTDTPMYCNYYLYNNWYPYWEPAYVLLQRLLYVTFGTFSYTPFLLGVGFVSILVKFKAFEKISPLIFIPILYYYCSLYFMQEHNQMRQGVSVGFVLFSLYYLAMGRKKKYFLYLFFACCFHYSSFVIIACYILNRYKNSRLFLYYLIGSACGVFMILGLPAYIGKYMIVFSYITPEAIAHKIESYSTTTVAYDTLGTIDIGALSNLYFVFVFGYYRDKIKSNVFSLFFLTFFIGTCLNLLFSNVFGLGRLGFPFLPVGGILFAYVLWYEKRFSYKMIHFATLVAMSLFKFYNSIVLMLYS